MLKLLLLRLVAGSQVPVLLTEAVDLCSHPRVIDTQIVACIVDCLQFGDPDPVVFVCFFAIADKVVVKLLDRCLARVVGAGSATRRANP